MSALLEISGLSKRFGGLVALSNVAMTVGEGEVRGVIGPNGSGKSTMFNLVTASIPPTPAALCGFAARTSPTANRTKSPGADWPEPFSCCVSSLK